jgi:hypothetical protein
MIKAVPLFLIALLLIDATIAVPQEARAEIKAKSNGISPASGSPVQTQLYRHKRLNNNDYKDNYKKIHKKKKHSHTKHSNKYLLAEPGNDEYENPHSEGYYTRHRPFAETVNDENPHSEGSYPRYRTSRPSSTFHHSRLPYRRFLLENRANDKYEYPHSEVSITRFTRYPTSRPSYQSPYQHSDQPFRYLLENRANDEDQNQVSHPDWGQNDHTGQLDQPKVLLQYYQS